MYTSEVVYCMEDDVHYATLTGAWIRDSVKLVA